MKRAFEVAATGIVGLLVFLGLLGIYKVFVSFGSKKDFWDVATAIGTCGAVAVALWVALRQESSTRRAQIDRAGVVASRLTPRLTIAANEASGLVALIEWYEELGKHDANYLTRVLKVAEQVAPGLNTDELVALTPLPNRCAFHAARAVGFCDVLVSAMKVRKSDISGTGTAAQEITHWLNIAINILESISIARDECVRVSASLTYISDDERYAPMADSVKPR